MRFVKHYDQPLVLAFENRLLRTFFISKEAIIHKLINRIIMFGLFKKKTEKEKLLEQYKKLQEEAYRLSTTDRKASDAKTAEAAELLKKIDALEA